MAITKHPEGSLKELWSIAFPLMLSSFSVMSMLFVDRIFLAHYSTAALNAAVTATTLGWAFVLTWMVMTSISEVFVAQLNGAGLIKKLGEPVWQMIWVSFLSFAFYIPLALWGASYLFGNTSESAMEREYFKWMMFFGPSFSMYGALCGFFVGQGKPLIITILAVVANLVNAFLDLLLIFGIPGFLEPMGIKGAAIATSGSAVFQVIVLAILFLNRSNREQFHTANLSLDSKLMWQCVKIGLPGAIFVGIEVTGWATFYAMMNKLGERYITIAGICQSIAILFYFFAEGINKAVTTIAGNMIGSKRMWFIPDILKASVKLNLLFIIMLGGIFTFSSDLIIHQFLPFADPETLASLHNSIMIGLTYILIYLLFDGLRLSISGVLTAAGDTYFLLIAGSLSVWVLMVLPVYLFILKGGGSIETAIFFWVFYSIGAAAIYWWRYLNGSWKDKSILT